VKATLSPTLLRFIIVGLSNTVISYLAFIGLHRLLETAFFAQAIAYAAGICWSYAWNSRWTFGQAAYSRAQFVRFVVAQLSLLALSALLIGVAVDGLRLHATASWLAVMALITIVNYLVTKRWVFGRGAIDA
jgi:putative flippase GtrA